MGKETSAHDVKIVKLLNDVYIKYVIKECTD